MNLDQVKSHVVVEQIHNARIDSVKLEINEHHGILDMWLMLHFHGYDQGFGGYALYLAPSHVNHQIRSFAGHHIFSCMRIAGVTQFNDMKGKAIRAAVSNGLIVGIGHIVEDEWYCPKADFANIIKG